MSGERPEQRNMSQTTKTDRPLARAWVMSDQAVASLTTFLMTVIIARVSGAAFLGEFTIVYGLGLGVLRIQNAMITMPMATTAVEIREKFVCFLEAQLWFTLVSIAFLLATGLLAGLFMVGRPYDIYQAVSVALGLAALLVQDFARRYFLTIGRQATAFFLTLAYGSIVLLGIALTSATATDSTGGTFLAMAVGGAPAVVIFLAWIWRYWADISLSPRALSFKRNYGLAATNLLQWLTSQVPNYVLYLLGDTRAVGIFTMLRSVVAPLNIIVLSFEGILPMKFARVRAQYGNGYVIKKAWLETSYFGWIIVFAALTAAFGGRFVIHEVFHFDEEVENVAGAFLLLLAWYLFAATGRVFLIANRAFGNFSAGVVPSFVNLSLLLLTCGFLTSHIGMAGTAASLAFAEFFASFLVIRTSRRAAHS